MIGKKYIFYQIKKIWNDFEKKQPKIALNILYMSQNTEEIRHAYKSKHNLKRQNQVIFLMMTDGESDIIFL